MALRLRAVVRTASIGCGSVAIFMVFKNVETEMLPGPWLTHYVDCDENTALELSKPSGRRSYLFNSWLNKKSSMGLRPKT